MKNKKNLITSEIIIRQETKSDYDAILRLTYEAFLTLYYPEKRRMDEHFLVFLLQDSDSVIPELCFVAEMDGEIVGHILYTKSRIERADGTEADTITFGPVSVVPKFHKQGIGKKLVHHSMEKAQEMGYGAVLIVGVPTYYPKLGFKRASEYGLSLADGSSPDAFMVHELTAGYLSGRSAVGRFAPEFEAAENDDIGCDAFNRKFMSETFPGELTLRPFFENDMTLMKRWLYADHVDPWCENPLDWLKELRGRYGVYSFITHMIAEVDGVAVGFCQYYDCDQSEEYEDWGMDITSEGEVFSIDYLIGEPEYLHRGYGEKIISIVAEKLRLKGAKEIIVLSDTENTVSNRALESSGFAWDGERYFLRL